MGQLMYFVKVNVVIHVYKTCTLLSSYWKAAGAIQYLSVGCIALRYVFGKLRVIHVFLRVTLAMVPAC